MELIELTKRTRLMMNTLFQKRFHSKISVSDSIINIGHISYGIGDVLPVLFGVKEIGEDRIVDYIVYNLYIYRNAIEEGKWRLQWLFSNKSVQKYKAQFIDEGGKSGINYYINAWLDEVELSRDTLAKMINDKKPALKAMVYMMNEEPIKMRFHNTQDGLMFCQANTTGWSPFSESCSLCNSVDECMIMTEQKFPELMNYRKEFQNDIKKK